MMEYIKDGRAWIIIAVFYLLGLGIGFIRSICIKKLHKESLTISNTKNNYLKHIKLKFENICKLEKNVYSSKTFVEKNLMDTKCCGVNIHTMKYINRICTGMIIYLGIFFAGYAFYDGANIRSDVIYLYGLGSVTLSLSLILLEMVWMTDLRMEKTLINISSYLDNHRGKSHVYTKTAEINVIKPQSEYIEKTPPITSNEELKLIYERESTDNKLIEEILREYL